MRENLTYGLKRGLVHGCSVCEVYSTAKKAPGRRLVKSTNLPWQSLVLGLLLFTKYGIIFYALSDPQTTKRL